MTDDLITITTEDINEANQLSLHCPICVGPVERNVAEDDRRPVVCTRCDTLYHRACWEQNGGKCAILGCGHGECRPYGTQGHVLKITASDIPSDADVAREQRARLKQTERARQIQRQSGRQVEKSKGFWQRLFEAIRRAFD
jgi:hypothetical protein